MKPILFNTEMVRAILDGRKTVTRRVVKPQPPSETHPNLFVTPPYRPGDILYVRETWSQVHVHPKRYLYKADADAGDGEGTGLPIKWHPSIHMPREAARIFLRVTDVRVERLQDITEEQAEHEGCRKWYEGTKLESPARSEFCQVWDSTIMPSYRSLYDWDSNPWIWVIEFERISREEATKC